MPLLIDSLTWHVGRYIWIMSTIQLAWRQRELTFRHIIVTHGVFSFAHERSQIASELIYCAPGQMS